VRVVSGGEVVDPVWDSAVSRALMLRVAAGEVPETLRVSRPGPAVVFGKRDVVSERYDVAVAAAHAGGYEAVERLGGGRAAAFHDGTLHFGHALRSDDPRAVTRRFEETAGLVVEALERLGIDARVGEVAGEYCAGEYSVNARGVSKLAGLGQRVIKDGAYVGGVLVVSDANLIRDVLRPVYEALNIDWVPERTGSVVDERPSASWDVARAALEAVYAERYGLEPAELDAATLALAEKLMPEHRSSAVGARRYQ
jgi:lipoate-protein ligase A